MKFKGAFLTSIFLLIIVAALHYGGQYLYLYWRLEAYHYDKFVHLIAGFWVAFTTLSIMATTQKDISSAKKLVIISLISTLIIGFLWELFELRIGYTYFSDPNYFIENGSDMIIDVIGGLAGAFYFLRKYKTVLNNVWNQKSLS